MDRTLHIERSLAGDGSWITSVAVVPSSPRIRQLAEEAGRPPRTSSVTSGTGTLSRLVFHEASGEMAAYDVAGVPVSLHGAPASGSPQRTLDGTSYGVGSFLTHLVTDSSQASAKREAVRRAFGETLGTGGDGDRYRRPVTGGEMELLLDSKTGLVKEETVQRGGETVSRTVHTYKPTGDGRYVRSQSHVSQQSRNGAMRSYVITFSNVIVDGVLVVRGGKP